MPGYPYCGRLLIGTLEMHRSRASFSGEEHNMDKIHHIAIQVEDINKAVDWYCSQFDVEVGYQDETWAMLKFDNIYLAIVIPGQHPPHFAIEDENAEKYGELTPHRDGTASIYINDPFGNSIEIMKTR